jgi:hypothetical protein
MYIILKAMRLLVRADPRPKERAQLLYLIVFSANDRSKLNRFE